MVTKAKFKFIAGTLCLDFVNTVGGRLPSAGNRRSPGLIVRDKLSTFADLVEWSRAARILTAAESRNLLGHSDAADVFHRAIALREALYRIARACVESRTPPPADLAIFNRELAAARAHERLRFLRGNFVSAWDQPRHPARILWIIVRSAARFFESPSRAAIRECPGQECGWLFLDTSRNHSRRWCEMQICGNRAKLRRFRGRPDPR